MIDIIHRHTKAVLYRSETAATLGAAAKEALRSRANLTDADLTDANLTDANLTDANLTDADLMGANLTRADLTDADLTRANLTDADLTRADLTGANLMGADLTDADLTRADLTGANLMGANLTRANLSNSNCGTGWGDFLRLTGSRHPIVAVDEDNISIGCMRHDLAWWREHYAAVGRAEGYSNAQVDEYRLHIEYVASWLSSRKVER